MELGSLIIIIIYYVVFELGDKPSFLSISTGQKAFSSAGCSFLLLFCCEN